MTTSRQPSTPPSAAMTRPSHESLPESRNESLWGPPSYSRGYLLEDLVWVCDMCAAVVLSSHTDSHDEWHQRLAAQLVSASF